MKRVLLYGTILHLLITFCSFCKPAGELKEESPCGNYRVFVERHPMLFAMPGQGSDAPATVRIADSSLRVLHEFDIEMVQLIDFEWQYTAACTSFRQKLQESICLPALPPKPGKAQRILAYEAIEQIQYRKESDMTSRPDAMKKFGQLIAELQDVNIADQRGRLLLTTAVRNRNIILIKEIMAKGANINGIELHDSPLHNFWFTDETFAKDLAVLKVLLSYSPDLQKKNKWGDTVLNHLQYNLKQVSGDNKAALQKLLNRF